MIKQLSLNIVSWQIKKKTLSDEQRALYQYAYEVFINLIINVLITIALAFVLHAYVTVFISSVCCLLLKGYCGGYHAKTHGDCIIISTLLTLLICVSVKCINQEVAFIISPICFAITGILVFLLAPVEDKNKPLDEIETIRYRKRGRYIWLIEAAIGMIFWYFKLKLGVIIALTHIIFSIILVLGELKNNLIKD